MSKKHHGGSKPDSSPQVVQRDKLKDGFSIKEFPWTEKQQKFIAAALDKNTKIIFCKSCPGTGKTLLSLFCCLQLLSKKSISNVIYYRSPIESASRSLGFLGGDYEEKISRYGGPLYDHLNELLDKATTNRIMEEKRLSVESIGFAKGLSHHVTGVILDESEDLSLQEIELIMCRMGQFSKLFIIGDIRQANIRNSGFETAFNLFNDEASKFLGIHTFEFDSNDCMRSPILKFIVNKFEGASLPLK